MVWWCLAGVGAHAADRVVGPGGEYATVALAVAAADDGDRIVVAGTIAESVVLIGRTLELVGDPAPALWKPGDDAAPLIDVIGGEITLRDLTLDGLDLTQAVRTDAAALVVDALTVQSVVAQRGAAFEVLGGSVAIANSDLIGGLATDHGGLIFSEGGATVEIRDSTLQDGVSSDQGGAVFVEGSHLVFLDSAVLDSVAVNGPALYLEGSTGEIRRSRFCRNAAIKTHHTAVVIGADSTWTNNLFFQNTAVEHGILDLTGGTHTVHNNVIAGNQARFGSALALWWDDLAVDFRNNVVIDNIGEYGAAVWVDFDTVDPALQKADYNAYAGNVPLDTDLSGANDLVDADLELGGGDCAAEAFAPEPDSPLVDGGDPGIADPDGSRSDVGLFGGPEADWEPPPVDTGTTTTGPGTTDPTEPVDTGIPPGTVPPGTDCVPRTEIRDDGIDQDCDGEDLVTTLGGPAPCGCRTGPSPGLAVAAVLLLGLGRRKRCATSR